MTFQSLNCFNFLLSIGIGLVLAQPGLAQETFCFGESMFEISASESQAQELNSLEEQMDQQTQTPLKTIESAQKQLRQLAAESNKKLEEILNAEQLASVNSQRRAESKEVAKRNAEHTKALSKLLSSGIATSDLVVFEGLPPAPKEELEKIIEKAETFKVDQWIFYQKPLDRTPSNIEKIRSTLVDFHTFEPYVGGKFCGKFHPDLGIHWITNAKEHKLLICLGCSEALYLSPDEKINFDFSEETWESFAAIDGFAGQTRREFLKQRLQGGGMF